MPNLSFLHDYMTRETETSYSTDLTNNLCIKLKDLGLVEVEGNNHILQYLNYEQIIWDDCSKAMTVWL